MKNPFQRYTRRFHALEIRMMLLESALQTLLESPAYVDGDEIGFNGQKIRKSIYKFLLDTFRFEAILETGTFTGNTTGYMARTSGLPVLTCESNSILAALARKRPSAISNAKCHVMDSRGFLKSMSETDIRNKRVFIYLDAHVHEDLPLKEEIEIICRTWQEFVIMIDDFRVPDDAGYGYDSYGKKQVLAVETFGPLFFSNGLIPFFPAPSSKEETGARRGSVILTRKGPFAEQLARCSLLKG
jgi:hypothetical protein